ncbi:MULTISPECIES: AI-2E family transporter [Thiorhodovibrio]|uniref:AI-2E family transporter n=1 Tax=Thiorhodovibrio TaxID=61593 RepID=UPI002B261E35|nr:AI-2E family transporter [Thiorhodovibrio litoralis]WPL10626.1 putative inner membrane protein [Thiorhodovibrio litoralis]
MSKDQINNLTILLMTLGISALFLSMIHQFLMVIFLSGLFSALARPFYLRFDQLFGGRRHLASLVTLLAMVFIILIPLTSLIGVVVAQAIDVSQSVTPWVKKLSEPGVFAAKLEHLPFYDELGPYRELLISKAGEAVSIVSKFLVGGLSSLTLGTANVIFMAFVMLYTMYFLQMDGDKLVEKILYYLPLKSSDEHLMLDRFTSVTRATLKGSLLIGAVQGTLAGIAFAVAGIDNAVFWGTVMAVLSVIPSVGSALVWIPAVILLIVQGQMVSGILLALFCGLFVGSLDNFLRPILIGKDTKMHELMIFFGTLGGIMMFGISGIFIGPLIASLFITVWDMYGTTFRHLLPAVEWTPSVLPIGRRKPADGDDKERSASADSPLGRGPRRERDEHIGPAVEDQLHGDEESDDPKSRGGPLSDDQAAK